MLFHTSFAASVTHLNLGLPTRLFGGFHGIMFSSGFGANVICFTGCSFGILCILASFFILPLR